MTIFLDTECFQNLTSEQAYGRLADSAADAGIPDCVWQQLWDNAVAGDLDARLSLEELIQVEILG
jgi:hypothetical protein